MRVAPSTRHKCTALRTVRKSGSAGRDEAESTYVAAYKNLAATPAPCDGNTGETGGTTEAAEEADQSPTSDGGRSSWCSSASHWWSGACASTNSAMRATSACAVSYKPTGAQSARKPSNDSNRNVSTEARSEGIRAYLRGTDREVSSYYTRPNVPHLVTGMSFGLLSSAK